MVDVASDVDVARRCAMGHLGGNARPAKPIELLWSTSQATSTWPAAARWANRAKNGRAGRAGTASMVNIASDVVVARRSQAQAVRHAPRH
jgi:hypothetical protein